MVSPEMGKSEGRRLAQCRARSARTPPMGIGRTNQTQRGSLRFPCHSSPRHSKKAHHHIIILALHYTIIPPTLNVAAQQQPGNPTRPRCTSPPTAA